MKKFKSVPKQIEKVVEKVIVNEDTVVEEEGGFIPLLGKKVFVQCMNYNYSGILSGVNTTCIELNDAAVVFETGSYAEMHKKMKVEEAIVKKRLYIQTGAIESFWEL